MLLAVEIIGILSMLTFVFIGIWSFIIFNKIYGQLKYKNYLIEKINHNLFLTNKSEDNKNIEDANADASASTNNVDDNDEKILEEASINAYDFGALTQDKKEL
jgi:hypothetical protein